MGGKMIKCIMPWISLNLMGGTQGIKICYWQNFHINPEKFESLEDIWNSERAQKIRMKMINGDITEFCPKWCPFLVDGNYMDINRLKRYQQYVKKESSKSAILDNIARAKKNIEDKKVVLDSKPVFLEIYKPHKCNIDCVMCWEKYYEPLELGINRNSLSDFEDYFESSKIIAFKGGEPLVSSSNEILNVLNNHLDKHLDLNTNGTLLQKIDFERYIHRFNNIIISLNAADREMHEKINRGSSWVEVISNIKKLVALKKIKELRKPDITIHMTVLDLNYKQIPDFFQLGEKLGCNVSFGLYQEKGYPKGDIVSTMEASEFRTELLEVVERTISYIHPKRCIPLEGIRISLKGTT